MDALLVAVLDPAHVWSIVTRDLIIIYSGKYFSIIEGLSKEACESVLQNYEFLCIG